MVNKRQLLYTAYNRGLKGFTSKDSLEEALGEITPAEIAAIQEWEKLSKEVSEDMYSGYSVSELATYLGIKTGFYFPLSPVATNFTDKMSKRSIIAFYHISGYDIRHEKPTYTDEQRQLCYFDSGVIVVNAGPGTGKTTIGVERAFAKKDEGVIILSYSNESVNVLYNRFKEIPKHRGKVGKKSFTKANGEPYAIVVTTIDSLAWKLSGKGDIDDANSSHDKSTKEAIRAIAHGVTTSHKHIIVDESQDIDDSRGEIVKLLFASGNYKSMLILGDPRQRISSAGSWYTDIWIKGSYTTTTFKKPELYTEPFTRAYAVEEKQKDIDDLLSSVQDMEIDVEFTFQDRQDMIDKSYIYSSIKIDVTKVGLTVSHRFKNLALLKLHNSISETRPLLHVELITSDPSVQDYGKFKCYNVGNYHDEKGMIGFASFIKTAYIDSKHCSPQDICVIMPSVSSENTTSKKAQKLCVIFKEVGINCYTRKEGSFIPNGILFTTIQSVKGKEFKVVIMYCMSEFPRFHPQIPSEQGNSLVYVANTRATSEIIYLCNETFTPPRGVPIDYFESVKGTTMGVQSRKDIELKAHPFGVTNILSCRGWNKLIDINKYTVEAEAYYECPKLPEFNIGNDRIKGVFAGLAVETLTTGSHLEVFLKIKAGKVMKVDNMKFIKFSREGKICNGFWTQYDHQSGFVVIREDGVNTIRDDEYKELTLVLEKEIHDLDWADWTILTQIYDYVCGGHMESRHSIDVPDGDFPYNEIKAIADTLIGAFGPAECEVNVSFAWTIGSCDLLFKDTVVELKTTQSISNSHRQQAMIYSACLPPGKSPFVYNLIDGRMEKIGSPQHILLWKYILDAYGTIRNHKDIVIQRRNNMINRGIKIPNMPSNTYVADTEFDSEGIFDFAMVSLTDPFCAIVQPLFSRTSFAVDWIANHHTFWTKDELKLMFSQSRRIKDLGDSFIEIGDLDEALCLYYKAKQDTIIPKSFGVETQDVSPYISRAASVVGASTEGAISVKLGEIYDLLVQPLAFQKHLHQHSALTDSLIIYEMFQLGLLK
jgi:hypothetical protein